MARVSFFVNDTVNGVFYCKESGFGEMPDDVVREVNDARAQFRSN